MSPRTRGNGGPHIGPVMHVVMHGRHIADLRSTREGRATLTYVPGAAEVTRGLSASLPVSGVRFSGDRVTNWLAGLLPDRGEVLARWRAQYGVRRLDAYALLWFVGQDVAGAARFVHPPDGGSADATDGRQPDGRADQADGRSALRPLSSAEVGARIRDLVADATSWVPSTGTGQFSLAGAQAKFALARTDSGWAEPSGDRATTHIFKPAIPGMPDQDLNEHLTMRLAASVGLPVARTEVHSFDGARALVVERFDRYRTADGTWRRVHQEDAVQALGLSPMLKYEALGGPGVRDLVSLLRAHVTGPHRDRDVATFIDAVAFNWFVVGTDAHARNYALMHHGPATRLAPLYDLNSFLPYASDRPSHLAMRIGFTQTDPARVGARDWDELARDCELDGAETLARVAATGRRILGALGDLRVAGDVLAPESDVPTVLTGRLEAHVESCLSRL